tara:strand:- start:6 stop:752 length:747 start_codon:yes stop_codon:yes gene_type:complete
MNQGVLGTHGIGGMDISGVIYTYNPIKELEDDFVVTVENDRVGGGFVFQDTEDWSQKYGGKIKKVIPLAYTPIAVFGDGRIRTSGTGTIEDASVMYIYRFDACFDPQSDPNCPGYVKPKPPPLPEVPDYDALQDESVKLAQEETDRELLEDEEAKEEEEEEEEEEEMEMLLATTENALAIADGISQSALMATINQATNVTSYYVATIPDSYYPESVTLQGGTIVDNRRALRSLSQDARMNEMIEEQYK